MKGLPTLMRLAQAEIDARQRALGEIDARLIALEEEARAHERGMAAEAESVGGDPGQMATFGAYIQFALAARTDFVRRRQAIEQEAESVRAGLNEAFLELKRLELVVAKVAQQEFAAAEARERAAFDEAAITRYARRT